MVTSAVSSAAIKFRPDISLYILRRFLGFSLTLMLRFRGSPGLSGCCGIWVYTQSMGEEGKEYRRLFL
jgi:hypothetical protein